MIERTQTPENLLDVMEELELLHVEFLGNDGWIKVTDRKTLFRAAITALMECAESEGYDITTCDGDRIRPTVEVVDSQPEPCDQLGSGCTCEDCTAQINEALGFI